MILKTLSYRALNYICLSSELNSKDCRVVKPVRSHQVTPAVRRGGMNKQENNKKWGWSERLYQIRSW